MMLYPCIPAARSASRVLSLLLALSAFNDAPAQHAVTTLCGTAIQGNPLAGPNGLCLDPNGSWLYLADYSAHQVKRINPGTGAVTVMAGTGSSGYSDSTMAATKFSYPTGICISSDGLSMYVCDNNNCLIRKIDLSAGTVSTAAGVYNAFSFADSSDGKQAQFNQPYDVVMANGDSALYISDSENHVIRKLHLATGAVSTVAGTPETLGNQDGAALSARFRTPAGLALSAAGDKLYVADAGNHRIRVVDLTAETVSTLAGSTQGYTDDPTGTQAMFYSPRGIALLPGDSLLYVIDTYNDRIRTVNTATTGVSTHAGGISTPSSHFANSNNGLMAKFYRPVSGVVSNDGTTLYISDQENFRIRKMNTDILLTSTATPERDGGFHIYPNPAGDNLVIRLPNDQAGPVRYTLTDITGHTSLRGTIAYIPSQQRAIIRLDKLASGTYLLRLWNGVSHYTYKLIHTD